MKVLFDTSVVIPMIVDVSLSNRLFERLLTGGHEIVVSQAILSETKRNYDSIAGLRRWHSKDDEAIQRFLDRLPTLFQIAPGALELLGGCLTIPTTTTSSPQRLRRNPNSSSPRIATCSAWASGAESRSSVELR